MIANKPECRSMNLCRRKSGFVPLLSALICGSAAHSVLASGLVVDIKDRSDDPIDDVAVYLLPVGEARQRIADRIPAAAVMRQEHNAFIPHVLIVETGAQVSFPNDDTVSHHVYSFSDAKRFQLDLYRGNTHPPQLFDAPGLVGLGCNIHDSMLGYILVVDTPYFATTDEQGRARFGELPKGEYELLRWTPRVDQDDLPAPQIVSFGDNESRSLSLKVEGKLRPPHDTSSGSLSWNAY